MPATTVTAHRRFPTPSDLGWHARLGIRASATADVALRTAAATLVSTTVLPHVRDRAAREADAARLPFYRDLGTAGSPDDVHDPPAPDVHVRVHGDRSLPTAWGAGRLRSLRFPSGFVPLHPEVRVGYLAHERNRTAWAQHWTHDDGPRPTIVVVHGFMASPYWVNRAFLQLPWFYGHGYDILLVTLPFHGARRDSLVQYSGAGLFAGGVSHLVEALAHGLHDLRAWVGFLLDAEVPQVGITGISLGGHMSALLASVDDRLSFAIPNVPVVDIADLLTSWIPAGWLVRAGLRQAGRDQADLRAMLSPVSPLTWPARVPHDRRFVIAGLGDRLAPPSQAEALWRHWGRPLVHGFPGNHVLHVDQGAYLKQMGRFLQRIEFGGG